MSDIAERAIKGEDKNAFDTFRKILALGIGLTTGEDGGEAALQADKAVFQKTVECAVGTGELSVDVAVDSWIDRCACHLSEILNEKLPSIVETGCKAAGGWIGSFFGPAGTITGIQIGEKAAAFLNTNITPELIDTGVQKMKHYAKEVYKKGKDFIKKGVAKGIGWIKKKICS